MGKGVSKSDYQPSDTDKANASIAVAQYQKFKTKYQPVLLNMRDKAMDNSTIKIARTRANADAMQKLTGSGPNLPAATKNGGLAAEVGKGLAGQLNLATTEGTRADNNMAAGVLASANQQSATAQNALGYISRLDTDKALQRAERKQSEKATKLAAGLQLASSFVGSGLRNMEGGGKFFTPNVGADVDSAGNPIYEAPQSLGDRLNIGTKRIT
tara:strand:- start:1535 stop:2173 length:639 start_codon:yes stop_codon:yes gene_type:complete